MRKVAVFLAPVLCLAVGAQTVYQGSWRDALVPSVELSFIQGMRTAITSLNGLELSSEVQIREDNKHLASNQVIAAEVSVKHAKVNTHKKAAHHVLGEEMDTQGLALLISTSLVADALIESQNSSEKNLASLPSAMDDFQEAKTVALESASESIELINARQFKNEQVAQQLSIQSEALEKVLLETEKMNTQTASSGSMHPGDSGMSTQSLVNDQMAGKASKTEQMGTQQVMHVDAKAFGYSGSALGYSAGGREYSAASLENIKSESLETQNASGTMNTQAEQAAHPAIIVSSLNPKITKVIQSGVSTQQTLASASSNNADTSVGSAMNTVVTQTQSSLSEMYSALHHEAPTAVNDAAVRKSADSGSELSDFSAQIFAGFTGAQLPVVSARAQILGSPRVEISNAQGIFSFGSLRVLGMLPVHLEASDYFSRNAEIFAQYSTTQSTQIIELLPRNTVRAFELQTGETQNPNKGVLFGQLVSELNEDLTGFEISLVQLDRVDIKFQPKYLSAAGTLPKESPLFTQENGQFLMMNLDPGTYILLASHPVKGERASHVLNIDAGEGIIQKFNLGRPMSISGRVLNATTDNAPVKNAEIQILGTSARTLATKTGEFSLNNIYVDCLSRQYIQAQRQDYYRNRMELACDSQKHSYYIFPKSHIDALAAESEQELESHSGLIAGHLNLNQSVRVQLLAPGEILSPQGYRGYDFYFDEDATLAQERTHTSRAGNFVILNAPTGLSYIQAIDHENKSILFSPAFLSESTVLVYVGGERISPSQK